VLGPDGAPADDAEDDAAGGHADVVLTGVAAPGRLDAVLAALPGAPSRSRVQGLLTAGEATVDGLPVTRGGHRLRGGEVLTLRVPAPPAAALVAQDLGVPVVHLDADVIVVDKPAGMAVHPARGHADGTLVNAVLHLLSVPAPGTEVRGHAVDPARPGVVHRLDLGTTGLLVLARTPAAHAHLGQQFHDHTVERRYLALVRGAVPDGPRRVDAALGRHPTDRLRFAVRPDGRRAVTHVRPLGVGRWPGGGAVSLVACRLETGRTHQVRVHLASLGHPLVGDALYGEGRGLPPLPDGRVPPHPLLHAAVLGFAAPDGSGRRRFCAGPPPCFAEVAAVCGLGAAAASAVAAWGAGRD